ncbi:MAG: regulatory protein RecX [Alphaproteobacteria bacterium]|nr:regulatory protein RecX [Alphaproteobacteria bacterium]
MKKMSYKRLYNKALFYLSRYSSSSENLRQVLERNLKKASYEGQELPPDSAEWIDKIVADFLSLGYLDDKRYIEGKVRSLVDSGKSTKIIFLKLIQKGCSEEEIENAFNLLEFDKEKVDMKNAKKLVLKRKIGFCRSLEEQDLFFQKDLAVLARAGFSFNIAQKALKGEI